MEQSHQVVEMIVGQSLNLIPSVFKDECLKLITNILRQLNGYNNINSTEVKPIIDKVQSMYGTSLHYFGTPNKDLLWNATFETGKPHMLFLGPPTTMCFTCSN